MKLLTGKDPLQLILKLPGAACNLRCTYCYENQRSSMYNASTLSAEAVQNALALFGDRRLSVQLHGGEPLLIGKNHMRKILDVLQDYPGRIDLTIQTNGILLDEEWLDLFDREWPAITIGISLDGDMRANVYRKDRQGKNRHKDIEHALRLCSERQRNVGIISVVNRNHLLRAKELLAYYSKFPCVKMINFMQNINFARGGPESNAQSVKDGACDPQYINRPMWEITPVEYGHFIMALFDRWKRDGYYEAFLIEPIYSMIMSVYGRFSPLCHFNQAKCFHIYTLYPDGLLRRCDELGQYDDVLYDNVRKVAEPLFVDSALEIFKQKISELMAKCNDCPYDAYCHGGCLSARLHYNGLPGEYDYCRGRSIMIDHIAREIGKQPICSDIPWKSARSRTCSV